MRTQATINSEVGNVWEVGKALDGRPAFAPALSRRCWSHFSLYQAPACRRRAGCPLVRARLRSRGVARSNFSRGETTHVRFSNNSYELLDVLGAAHEGLGDAAKAVRRRASSLF